MTETLLRVHDSVAEFLGALPNTDPEQLLLNPCGLTGVFKVRHLRDGLAYGGLKTRYAGLCAGYPEAFNKWMARLDAEDRHSPRLTEERKLELTKKVRVLAMTTPKPDDDSFPVF